MGRLSKIKRELIQEANKRLLGEDVESITPNFNISNGNVVLGKGKTYKLETEKMYMRLGIDIVSIDTNDDGTGLLVATHPISKKNIESKIRRSNFQKVIDGMDRGEQEIMIKNLEGKEFFLVRV